MFSLSARFRKSRTAGVPGSVYYVIRQGVVERNITGLVQGMDDSVMSKEKDRIASDLMTIYCVVENAYKDNSDPQIDDIYASAREALFKDNPYADRIRQYNGKYPAYDKIAKISKIFSDCFYQQKRANYGQFKEPDKSTLLGYISWLIHEYASDGKPYSKSLRSTWLSVNSYLNGKDIPLKEITGQFVSGYSAYLGNRVAANTASFYLRTLRTAIIRAERDKCMPKDFVWPENVKTNVIRAAKTTASSGLDIAVIRKIAHVDLSADKTLEFARDMFMFAFFAHGMELVDVASLKKDNLNGNTLVYRRRQKGKEHEIVLGDKAMGIIEKYDNHNTEYLFPIIPRKWEYSYTTAQVEISDSLNKIGQLLKPSIRLTFSMNIHSWQSIINSVNITENLVF